MAKAINALVVAALLVGPVQAESSLAGEGVDPGIARDAAAYAEMFGVTPEEAQRRMVLMASVGPEVDEISRVHAARFAGAWIEHVPEFRVVVSLTGPDDAGVSGAKAAVSKVAEAETAFSATHTLNELLIGLEALTPTVQSRHPDFGIGVNVMQNAVELSGPDVLSAEDLDSLSAVAGVRLTHDVSPGVKPGHTYGGKGMRDPDDVCTSGFSVQDAVSGRSGILTAGHCFEADATYVESSTIEYAADLGGKRLDANQDFAWYETGHDEYPKFWDGVTLRDVTGTKARLEMVGETVCHYGLKTGYSCGLVSDIHYRPSDVICGGVTCDPVWVKVSSVSGNLRCWFGDSGGPMFTSTVAWGIFSGQSSDGPAYGECRHVVMMSIGALKWDGVNTRIKLKGGGLG